MIKSLHATASSLDISSLLSTNSSNQTLSNESLANIVSILVKCEPKLIHLNENPIENNFDNKIYFDDDDDEQDCTSASKIKSNCIDCQKPPIPVKVVKQVTHALKPDPIAQHYYKKSLSKPISNNESSV